MQWLMVAGVSIAPLVIMELQKKANEVLFGKVVYEYKESNYSEVWNFICPVNSVLIFLIKLSIFPLIYHSEYSRIK